MLMIPCPHCGMTRPEAEFRHAGAALIARPPDPSSVSDDDWAAFLYLRDNPRGAVAERWRHVHGCGRFLNARRDTVTDRILATWRPGEAPPE